MYQRHRETVSYHNYHYSLYLGVNKRGITLWIFLSALVVSDRHHDDQGGPREAPKKRGLEAMLKPAVSPKRAKSPEEVDIYSGASNPSNNPLNMGRSLHQPYRPPNAGSSSQFNHRSPAAFHPSNNMFGKPMHFPAMSKNQASHSSSQPGNGPNHRKNSAEKMDASVS